MFSVGCLSANFIARWKVKRLQNWMNHTARMQFFIWVFQIQDGEIDLEILRRTRSIINASQSLEIAAPGALGRFLRRLRSGPTHSLLCFKDPVRYDLKRLENRLLELWLSWLLGTKWGRDYIVCTPWILRSTLHSLIYIYVHSTRKVT